MNYSTFKRTVLVTALCALPFQVTHAQSLNAADPSGIVAAINNARDTLNTTLGKIFDEVNKHRLLDDSNYNQEHPGYDDAAGKNLQQSAIDDTIYPQEAHLNSQMTESVLGPIPMSNAASILSAVVAGDSYDPNATSTNNRQRESALAEMRCGSYNLSLGSLIGPSSYDTILMNCDLNSDSRKPRNQATYASNYILYVSNIAQKMPGNNIYEMLRQGKVTDSDEADRLARSDAYRNYMTAKRGIVAVQSAATDTLYYLYQLRQPQLDSNGNKIGPSALESESNIATRRVKSPDWYAQMKAALPTVLNREAVMILAEIENELHLMRVEQQRHMALNAVSLLRAVQQDKQMLMMKAMDVDSAATRSKSVKDIETPSTPSFDSSSLKDALGKAQKQYDNQTPPTIPTP